MSIRAVAWCLDHSPATGTDKLVLIALANFADERDVAYPSIARIAHIAAVSERTARRVLRNLEEAGQIVTELGGGRYSNRYRLTYANPIDLPSTTPANMTGVSRTDDASEVIHTPAKMTGHPGQSDPPARTQPRPGSPDTAMTPEPSYNQELPLTPHHRGGNPRTPCPRHPQRPQPNCQTCETNRPTIGCTAHPRPRITCPKCHTASNPKPPPPAWCGQCDPQGATTLAGRQIPVTSIDGIERWMPCPRCHPSTQAGAA